MIESYTKLDLAHWRRTVAEMYSRVRQDSQNDSEGAWNMLRASRNSLFRDHPQSPLEALQKRAFLEIPYYPYSFEYRVIGQINSNVERKTVQVDLSTEGAFAYTRIAIVRFELCGTQQKLSLFWIEGYGGGLFLPFRDTSNGQHGTYGGGRYLYDTIKGADLGAASDTLVLDFNYAYNPSCAYSSRWVCPLPPMENRLYTAIRAGEKVYPQVGDTSFANTIIANAAV